MNRDKLNDLLVKSYIVNNNTVTPINTCECHNSDDPLVCSYRPDNYRCKYNLGEFTVGKIIYINCTARLPNE